MYNKLLHTFFTLVLCTSLGLSQPSKFEGNVSVTNSIQQAHLFVEAAQLDSAIWYYQLAIANPEIQADKIQVAGLEYAIGAIYVNDLQQYEEGKSHLSKAWQLIEASPTDSLQLNILDALAAAHYWLFESKEALNYAIKGQQKAQEIEGFTYEIKFSEWLGRVFEIQEQRDVALEYYQKVLELSQKVDEPLLLYNAYLNLGVTYYKNGKLEKGLSYLNNCVEYLPLLENRIKLGADIKLWQGIIEGTRNNFERKEQLLKSIIPIYDSLDIPNRRQHCRLELGAGYLTQLRYAETIEIVENMLQLDPERITIFTTKYAYDLLYRAHKGLSNSKEALFYYENFVQDLAHLDSINNHKQINELEKKYKEQEQQQIILQQQATLDAQNSRRRITQLILLLLTLLLLSTAFIIYFLQKTKTRLANKNTVIENQARDLQRLDKVKSQFFTNISHELRTPLTLILSPIQTALNRNRLENYDFTLLKKAQLGGQQLLKLVNSILDLSKIEAGKMKLQEESVILFDLMRRLTSLFESHAQQQNISFLFDYRPDKDLQIQIDKEKLSIILNNLLSNAIKFTPSNGEITVKITDNQKGLQISVSDTGKGIHPSDLPHIFDRFFQSKQPDTSAKGGTGIGLALSHEYATLMQGSLEVESTIGKGSIFILNLPLKEVMGTRPVIQQNNKEIISPSFIDTPALSTDKLKTSTSKKSNLPSLLIVEDNYSLRDYLQLILSDSYQLFTAENGQKALDLLEKGDCKPDLILSDIMMPVMDGYELLERLKSNESFRSLPVIMLTARADVQDKLRALRIGVDDYLLKPFDEEELLIRIENLLENSSLRAIVEIEESQTDENESNKTTESIISAEDQIWLKEIEEYVTNHLDDFQLSVTTLTYVFAMSTSSLSRRLKRLTGLAAGQYIQEVRLTTARRLLESGNVTQIGSISEQVGYNSQRTFSRSFKKRYGKSPSEYLPI